MELVAQGVANVASALFGGISVTGTIARTATNIRAGAYSPVSGMLHALFVLIFMLIAAPLASFVPLSALAGVLVAVCWNMAEKERFLHLLREWRGASVLLATFGLTLMHDLTAGIIAGLRLAAAFKVFRPRPAGGDAFILKECSLTTPRMPITAALVPRMAARAAGRTPSSYLRDFTLPE